MRRDVPHNFEGFTLASWPCGPLIYQLDPDLAGSDLNVSTGPSPFVSDPFPSAANPAAAFLLCCLLKYQIRTANIINTTTITTTIMTILLGLDSFVFFLFFVGLCVFVGFAEVVELVETFIVLVEVVVEEEPVEVVFRRVAELGY